MAAQTFSTTSPTSCRGAKRKRHQLSYDDLLVNLQTALSGPGGRALAERLRCDYVAVLLDEFQDTDPVQYEIFRAIYAGTEQPVFMVGDPKQAIYFFSGRGYLCLSRRSSGCDL